MNIAIIGGGFTGLTAAYELLKRGHTVTVFERDAVLGGLANGYKQPGWDWYLEKAYHHLFTNDHDIIGLIKELGLSDKLIIKRPITANFITPDLACNGAKGTSLRETWPFVTKNTRITDGDKRPFSEERKHSLDTFCDKAERSRKDVPEAPIYQLDSPFHLLNYPDLSIIDKLRTGALIAFCKLYPFWQHLEGITAEHFFSAIGGKQAWKMLWEPLMIGKFGDLAPTVVASWLWARVHKRTPRLIYIDGGFHTIVERLFHTISDHGGNIKTSTEVLSISKIKEQKSKLQIKYQTAKTTKTQNDSFDTVLLTVPTPIALKLINNLQPTTYNQQPLLQIPHLHAQTLIVETKEPILKDACSERGRGVYWLSVTDRSFPFLAVVAHTNMIDKRHYGNRHLTYFGNYLPEGHPYLSLSAEALLKTFRPFIQKINPDFNFKFQISNFKLFVGYYAQPVHQLHYSQKAPKQETGIPGVFLANMDSIYPWDRGTNYAVELGKRAAIAIHQAP